MQAEEILECFISGDLEDNLLMVIERSKQRSLEKTGYFDDLTGLAVRFRDK